MQAGFIKKSVQLSIFCFGLLVISSDASALNQYWKLVATFPDPASSSTVAIELADFKRVEHCGDAIIKLTDIKKTDMPYVMGSGRLSLKADEKVSYSCVLFMK